MATVHGQTARAARHRGLWLISGVARDEVHGQSTGLFSSHVVEARRLGGHGVTRICTGSTAMSLRRRVEASFSSLLQFYYFFLF
ncbi:hypothetical protein M0R45_019416 [Rubus argutus]|uniref:Uncharacterized protein n=1 Tax=Rubus argutus TaxID=59490 RepID=A0AAW1X5A7_RUBAR